MNFRLLQITADSFNESNQDVSKIVFKKLLIIIHLSEMD